MDQPLADVAHTTSGNAFRRSIPRLIPTEIPGASRHWERQIFVGRNASMEVRTCSAWTRRISAQGLQ